MSTSAARELIDPDRVLNWSSSSSSGRRRVSRAVPGARRATNTTGPGGAERGAPGLAAAALAAVAALTVYLLAARPKAP